MSQKGNRAQRQRNGPQILTGVRVTQQLLDGLQVLHSDFLRGVRNGRKIAMRRCDLSGLDFSSMQLGKAELLACNFEGSNLSGSNFRLANLFAANFNNTNLTGANLDKADLRASRFEHANLTGASLEGADLRDCAIMDDETNQIGALVPSCFRNAVL